MLAVIGLSIERFDHFATAFADIRLNVSNRTIACMDSSDWFVEFAPCNKWVCMSDFIFAVALLVNLGKWRCCNRLIIQYRIARNIGSL